ncbi:hypothetical protein J6590_047612 [Homalodisca vitripennis]|nr:hypothetical protein J6590_047612 [Homalodisca vitripennis]
MNRLASKPASQRLCINVETLMDQQPVVYQYNIIHDLARRTCYEWRGCLVGLADSRWREMKAGQYDTCGGTAGLPPPLLTVALIKNNDQLIEGKGRVSRSFSFITTQLGDNKVLWARPTANSSQESPKPARTETVHLTSSILVL